MKQPTFDRHGYPSSDTLGEIKRWPADDVSGLIKYLHLAWNSTYGHISGALWEPDGLRFVTGGWSGNEDLISALHGTAFWMRFWQSDHRGGMHVFAEQPEP